MILLQHFNKQLTDTPFGHRHETNLTIALSCIYLIDVLRRILNYTTQDDNLQGFCAPSHVQSVEVKRNQHN